MFGPVCGGHFNPVVSFVDAHFGGITWRDALAYLPAQAGGCILGAIVANGMFAKSRDQHLNPPPRQPRALPRRGHRYARADPGHLRARQVQAIHDHPRRRRRLHRRRVLVHQLDRLRQHPAITIGRVFSDTFAGIAPASVPALIVAQATGGLIALLIVRTLYPAVTPDDAATVLVPHGDGVADDHIAGRSDKRIGHNVSHTAMALHVMTSRRRGLCSQSVVCSSKATSSTRAYAIWPSSPTRTGMR